MTPTEIIELNLSCALIGFLIGNWLAIGRDRRKEFNALVEPAHDLVFFHQIPADITLLKIRERLHLWQKRGFDRAVEAYKQSKSTYNRNRKPDGGGSFVDGEKSAEDRIAIAHAADDLLKFLKPR